MKTFPVCLQETQASADPLLDRAKELFGISYLFPYQRLAIHNILSCLGVYGGEGAEASPGDQLIILPTGAGKSLCFQLPAALIPGLTLVVYPLLSLMADQERRLKAAGIRNRCLRGGQSEEERKELWQAIEGGEANFLIANPEILAAVRVKERLKGIGVHHLVIDEAHCVAEWGETFRPAYLELGKFREELKPGVTTAFTATASPEVLNRIVLHLFAGEKPHLISGNPDRPNLTYRVLPVLAKNQALAALLDPGPRGGIAGFKAERPAVVFCGTRGGTEVTAAALRKRLGEEEIFFYHAGLEREEKKDLESWFFSSKTGILTATCAYGLGVDKKDIRTVIHRDVPNSVEAYLQESGRAGRDGKNSQAALLVSPEDEAKSLLFTTPYEAARYAAPLAYARKPACRRKGLLALLGSESDNCSGCDFCDGSIVRAALNEEAILRFIAKNRRRFDQEETAFILTGAKNARTFGVLRGMRGFGLLPAWNREDAEEALANLLRSGKIRRIARFPWKGRLTLPPRRSE